MRKVTPAVWRCSSRGVGWIIAPAILLWSVSASSGSAPAQTYSRQVAASPMQGIIEERGFRVEEATGFVRREFTIVTVTLSPKHARVELGHVPETGVSMAEAADRLAKRGETDFVLLNGGFLRSFSPINPANFLKFRGEIVNPPTEVRDDSLASGVVCISASNEIRIVPSPSGDGFVGKFSDQQDCLQAGPLLVNDALPQDLSGLGETPRTSRFVGEDFSRSFIAIKPSGELVLGFSTPVSLGSLTEVMTSPAVAEASVSSALNLQGSTNGAMVAYSRGRPVYGRGNLSAAQSTYFVVLPRKR